MRKKAPSRVALVAVSRDAGKVKQNWSSSQRQLRDPTWWSNICKLVFILLVISKFLIS